MSATATFDTCIAVSAQIGVAIVGFGMLALTPPASGAMLLLPLVAGAPVTRLARDGDALLVAAGPRGSVIVRGDRRALFWPLLRAGVLTIAAPAGTCGSRG